MTVTSQNTILSHADVARRLLANVDAGTSDQSPGQMKVPATAYRDPGRWELEMERIFRRSPLAVALSCDVREPGDFDTVEIAQRPLLIVRGDDGVVRTFLNICRHRGAQVGDGLRPHPPLHLPLPLLGLRHARPAGRRARPGHLR